MPVMPGDNDDKDDKLVDALEAATAIFAGIALRSVETEGEGLTLAQYRVLALLDGMGDSLTGRVAMMLGVDASTVTRLGDRLVRAGHMERKQDPAHRGRVMLCLTGKGREVIRRVRAYRRAELHRILAQMPLPQRDVAENALRLFILVAGGNPPRVGPLRP